MVSVSFSRDFSTEPYGSDCYGIPCPAEEMAETQTAPGGGAFLECSPYKSCGDGFICKDARCVPLFDVKLVSVQTPLYSGSFANFTYAIKNVTEVSDDVIVRFRLEEYAAEKIISAGEETIFAADGMETVQDSVLWVPSGASGLLKLSVSAWYGNYSANASQTVEILRKGHSAAFLVSVPDEFRSRNGEVRAAAHIFSPDTPGKLSTVVVYISRENSVYFEAVQTRGIGGSTSIPMAFTAKPGMYNFTVRIIYENETLSLEREIAVTEDAVPILLPVGLLASFLLYGIPYLDAAKLRRKR